MGIIWGGSPLVSLGCRGLGLGQAGSLLVVVVVPVFEGLRWGEAALRVVVNPALMIVSVGSRSAWLKLQALSQALVMLVVALNRKGMRLHRLDPLLVMAIEGLSDGTLDRPRTVR